MGLEMTMVFVSTIIEVSFIHYLSILVYNVRQWACGTVGMLLFTIVKLCQGIFDVRPHFFPRK
jgi:hypothetical protein